MNRKQRISNRLSYQKLHSAVRKKASDKHLCENCGEYGGHFIALQQSLYDIITRRQPDGVYTCEKTK